MERVGEFNGDRAFSMLSLSLLRAALNAAQRRENDQGPTIVSFLEVLLKSSSREGGHVALMTYALL
jgi:hypothetical protein